MLEKTKQNKQKTQFCQPIIIFPTRMFFRNEEINTFLRGEKKSNGSL